MIDYAIFWLPIVGGILLGGFCVNALYSGKYSHATWFGFFGVFCFALVAAIQIQQTIWKSEDGARNPNRPYISIAAIGFPDIIIQAGPVIIKWDIKNSGRTMAKIIESNMTLWFATEKDPLPDTPKFIPTPRRFAGVEIGPGDTFNATFKSEKTLTQNEIEFIKGGESRLYVYGFVKFADESGIENCKGFISLYEPANDPRFGMFTRAEEDHPKYACGHP